MTDAVFLLVHHHMKKYMVSVCAVIVHVNFDHLDKVASARFLCHQVTIFPFVMSNYFKGAILRQYKSSSPHYAFTNYVEQSVMILA